jgi:uncharacterized protein
MGDSMQTVWILASGGFVQRHWAALLIAVTLVSLLTFVVLLLGRYVRIALNIFIDTPPPLATATLELQRLQGEEVRFRSFSGTSLRGMLVRCQNRNDYRGTIIFCHEYGADMYSCARYVRPLVESGFDIFTFDFRGHGESSNNGRYRPLQWPSDKELEDVLGATAHVESMLASEGKPVNIGLFGISRGAGAGLLAASSDPNIKAIVCDGAFCTDRTVISFMRRWAHIFARVKLVYEHHGERFWRTLLWWMLRFAQSRLGCKFPSVSRALQTMASRPIFFIHGRRDSYIRADQTRYLYERAPSPKYHWVVRGAKHNQSVVVEPAEYATRTIAFFRRHLAGEDVSETEITSPAEEADVGVA